MRKTITVEIWADLICPWCWIGKRRFERALADFAHRDQVEVIHRAFRLMPGQSPRPVDDLLGQRVGAARATAIREQTESEAATEGLTYRLAGTLAGDTLDGHRLVKLATAQGLQEAAIERFYRAYFSEQEPLFDRETLLRLGAEIGLDRAVCAAVLDSSDHVATIEDDQRRVRAHGSNGVPFFLIDGRLGVSGAQPADVFRAALEEAWNSNSRRPRRINVASTRRDSVR
ncbi:MAG: DsbA family oxidoreductase [Porticoccaceae bacterium]